MIFENQKQNPSADSGIASYQERQDRSCYFFGSVPSRIERIRSSRCSQNRRTTVTVGQKLVFACMMMMMMIDLIGGSKKGVTRYSQSTASVCWVGNSKVIFFGHANSTGTRGGVPGETKKKPTTTKGREHRKDQDCLVAANTRIHKLTVNRKKSMSEGLHSIVLGTRVDNCFYKQTITCVA